MAIALHQTELEKDVFEVAIDFDNLTIDKKEIELTIGYSDGKMPTHFIGLIEEAISQLSRYCEIRAGYRIVDAKKSVNRHDGLYVGGSYFNMKKIVTHHLRKAEKAALFVCTIGSTMETWARELLSKGDSILGYIVDTIASVTVENVTDVLHDHIEQQMLLRGFKITNRYSPGYCNWSVSEQHILFSLLPVHFCGITLNESALMVPIKSVSGIIGVGGAVKREDYICDRCGIKDCTYRASRLARVNRNVNNANLRMSKQ